MKAQSNLAEEVSADAPVCGNCFWRDYCLADFSFLRVDLECIYRPSEFEPIFHLHKKAIRALPEGSQSAGELQENFFTRVSKDFEIDETQCVDNLEYAVKLLIVDALNKNNWSQKLAAHYLKISSRRMNYYVQKFCITHRHWGKYHGRNFKLSEDTEHGSSESNDA